MLDSYLLEYFNAVAEEGTTLKASEKLNVSQPSVTKAIQKLEYELGIDLFDRRPNKIVLNENGRIISEYIKDAISIDKRIREKAKELKRKSLTIHVEMTAPGPTFKYPDFFYFEKDNNPQTLEIKDEKKCINDVISGIADVAFINSKIQIEDIYCEKIMDEKLYVYLPKNHFLSKKSEGVTFEELDGQSFLIAKDLGPWDKIVETHLKKSKFFRQEQENLSEIVSASSIPGFATNISLKFRNEPNRVVIPIISEDTTITFYAICKKDKLHILRKIQK